MKANEAILRDRFNNRPPSRMKNPRKLKKAWKRIVEQRAREIATHQRYRVHWVPLNGWTVTVKPCQ